MNEGRTSGRVRRACAKGLWLEYGRGVVCRGLRFCYFKARALKRLSLFIAN